MQPGRVPDHGRVLGELDQPDGAQIAITGLWDLEFGDGTPRGGDQPVVL
jgi:hypothetical protein